MKKTISIIAILLTVFSCEAHHIIGGEMSYKYLGKGASANTSSYLITLKIFRDQNVPPNTAPLPAEVYIGIFDNDDGVQFKGPYPYFIVTRNNESSVKVNPFPPCISNAPQLNYHMGIYQFKVDLPDNEKGYTAAYQTCCRVDNIENVYNYNGSSTGSTFTCSIPANKYSDSSPEFSTSVDVICAGKPFKLFYNATDADNDSLVYGFASAFDGGAFHDDQNANPAPPPYNPVNYISGYSAGLPLGSNATIDSKTGIISGIAPKVGKYVLSVTVLSYRNGVLLNEHRKDFIINVNDCSFAGAQLNPRPVICDSFNVSFENDNTSSLNQTFFWNFGDIKSGANNTSALKEPAHVYTDTGVFIYKLVINRGQQCSDSTTQILKVYPGFNPSFSFDGQCINSNILFTDKTTTNFGLVNSWSWNFDDGSNNADTSNKRNPTYIYTAAGNYNVQLTAGSSKGCLKTISLPVPIKTQPDFSLNNDTLICSIDTLQLTAIGRGNISWFPEYNINNPNSFTPLVSPKRPTMYFATLNESRGCIATDSVFVNVVDRVSLSIKPDTTICLTDTLRLNPISDGLHYLWTPSASIVNDTAKYAVVIPEQNTSYHVVASIGKCNTSRRVNVTTILYPAAFAGNDTTICFPDSIQLHATGGSIYNWEPSTFLNQPQIANPVSTPLESIVYTVRVNDVLGCPKPSFSTIKITVEKLVADAGPRDTSIVINQPLQLNGSGGDFYSWSPSEDFPNAGIPDPVVHLSDSRELILQVESKAGCTAMDTINVMVYKVKPDLYVPDAFTPNDDGKNDIFRPIPIGIKKLNFFKIYNRLGQLLYSTTLQKAGWDGTFRRAPQDPGVYVWIAGGVDYLGKTIFKKGSVTLLR